MPSLLLQIDDGPVVMVQENVKVIYVWERHKGDEVPNHVDESQQLHFKFNDEGFVTDAIEDDEVVATRSMFYGDVFEAMTTEDE